jgi:hypothetical protein
MKNRIYLFQLVVKDVDCARLTFNLEITCPDIDKAEAQVKQIMKQLWQPDTYSISWSLLRITYNPSQKLHSGVLKGY